MVPGVGQLAIAAVGTAAANILRSLLEGFVRSSTDETFVARPFLAEPSQQSRETALKRLPAYFRDRITVLDNMTLVSSGLKGKTLPEGDALGKFWKAPLREKTAQWLTDLRNEAQPDSLLLLVSSGRSARLGVEIARAWKAEHENEVFLCLVIDHKGARREYNLPPLLDGYGEPPGLIDGAILLDNQRASDRSDDALPHLFGGLLASPWYDELPNAGYNVLAADLFREHRVATIRVDERKLGCTYLPPFETVPEVWYTSLDRAQRAAIQGITAVLNEPELQSLPLPAAPRSHFVYVSVGLTPRSLGRLAERVNQHVRDIPGWTFDTSVCYASLAEDLTPQTDELVMRVIGLHPVVGGLATVKEYLLATQDTLAKTLTRTKDLPPVAAASDGHEERSQ